MTTAFRPGPERTPREFSGVAPVIRLFREVPIEEQVTVQARRLHAVLIRSARVRGGAPVGSLFAEAEELLDGLVALDRGDHAAVAGFLGAVDARYAELVRWEA